LFENTFVVTYSQTQQTLAKLFLNIKEAMPMKKILFLTLALSFGFAGFGHTEAQAARRSAPLWVCQLGFKGDATGFKIILGYYAFNGVGRVNCVSAIGDTVSYPVSLKMKAAPLSPSIALGRYTLYGQSAKISLFNTNPDDILGRYMVAQTHATIIGGVGAITAVKVGNPQLALTVSLQFSRGFGVDLALNQLTISRIHEDSERAVPN